MRTVLFFLILLIISCSEKFDVNVAFVDLEHISKIFLTENTNKIDSVIIEDYYGKNKIDKMGDNLWSIVYSVRCGTGCSMRNVILINIVNDRINVPLHMSKSYKEKDFNSIGEGPDFSSEVYIEKGRENDLLLRLEIKHNSKLSDLKEEKLTYDQSENVFYNCEFNYDDKLYKGVRLDTFEYIFHNKKWARFDSRKNKIFHDF